MLEFATPLETFGQLIQSRQPARGIYFKCITMLLNCLREALEWEIDIPTVSFSVHSNDLLLNIT